MPHLSIALLLLLAACSSGPSYGTYEVPSDHGATNGDLTLAPQAYAEYSSPYTIAISALPYAYGYTEPRYAQRPASGPVQASNSHCRDTTPGVQTAATGTPLNA